MSVVFTDNFTVGSNTNIDAYPAAGADYAYNAGSGANLTVNAANDRVQNGALNVFYAARIIDASVPTGDQEMKALCGHLSDASLGNGYVCARMATGGTLTNYYWLHLDTGNVNEVRVLRDDNGSSVLVDSFNDGIAAAAGSNTHRLKVTGAGATVTLEVQLGNPGTTHSGITDSTANRKTAGPPGLGAYNENAAGDGWVDDVSVDDLVSTTPINVSIGENNSGNWGDANPVLRGLLPQLSDNVNV